MLIFAPVLKKGPVAEWLGRALQKLLQRFESARDLGKREQSNRLFPFLMHENCRLARLRSVKAHMSGNMSVHPSLHVTRITASNPVVSTRTT